MKPLKNLEDFGPLGPIGRARVQISDMGFSVVVDPGTYDLPLYAPHAFKGERLYIEEVRGVTLQKVRVGSDDQLAILSCSTLFYSVPVSSKTIDRIKRMLDSLKGDAPDDTALKYLWDERCEPDAVLGLPIDMQAAPIGNRMLFVFENHGDKPVRVTGVLRGHAAV